MGFEKKVLNVVAKVTEDATFQYGTLFVNCTPRQATKIETVLIEEMKCGIIVTPQGNGEFSFDFC